MTFSKEKMIKEKQEQKAKERRIKSLRIMKPYGKKYKCTECFHRKSKSCTDNLPNGCEHWFNPKRGFAKIIA